MTQTDFAIEAENISRTFRSKKEKTIYALRDVSLKVRRGQIFGLLGPNGAGKTTMVRILTTILRPDEGTARILGHDIRKSAREVRKHIAVVLQETAVETLFSVKDNLIIYGLLHRMDRAEVDRRVEELMEKFELKEKEKEKAQDLSMGMRRRLQVAKVFLVDAPVVFLDEATTGMDPIIKRTTLDQLRMLTAQGRTIFLTTQLLEEAEQLCDEIAILHHGRTVASGDLQTLRALTEKKFNISVTIPGIDKSGIDQMKQLNPTKFQNQDGQIQLTVAGDEARILQVLADISRTRRIEHFEMRPLDLEDIFIELVGSAGSAE